VSVLAVTGGTGFVGSTLIAQVTAAGHTARVLTRRPQAPRDNVVWIEGSLETPDALVDLAQGAEAVIHIAGVINAPDRDGFVRGNIEGTKAMVAAAQVAKVRRFVHVSSLAAREPQLSIYGWSKAGAEQAVMESGLAWSMVRPPAVFGPGDMEMLELFRLARHGLALLPPGGRLSVIEVSDLGRLLLALAGGGAEGMILEPDDGVAAGWTHKEFARAIGDAMGRRIAPIALPRPLMAAGAQLDRLIRGSGAKLTPDRVAYFCHDDWVSDPAKRPPTQLWQPQVSTVEGLAATAAWYRAQGLV